ncbi:sulfite exporter TauE/SafE family protein [Haloplanus rubicundus]|uniref:Sulfite exporter TauE/SafE family protein n=1 Tax=Haloplanus rubicundus TaxID=1547898 RepID=A0A345E0I4_9EURY|nr:sulfite exporter TauE/SafE family protein [Haloplanus rubicundus]AXG05706.1 sulfite exporter TauE/SafE family protein [Haloplanus rubicundus]AXG09043.1 sulfite exporter TauE/SafE family protein [Haloplanus rubicundus]
MLPLAGASSVLPAVQGDVGLLVFLAIGVLGGAHCLGMCGPLVTLYADRMGSDAKRVRPVDVRQHLLFNAGRTASYALIGGVMGALGAVLFDAAAVAAVATDVRAVTGILVGGFIVFTGVGYVARGSVGHGASIPVVGDAFARVYGTVTSRVDRWVGGPRIVALGALHGVLPCPLLYPAFLYAFAVGSPARGALSLAVLGLGTVPTLLAYGTVFQSLGAGTRVGLHRILGVAFVALGYLPLAHGLMLLGIHLPHPPIPVYQPLG